MKNNKYIILELEDIRSELNESFEAYLDNSNSTEVSAYHAGCIRALSYVLDIDTDEIIEELNEKKNNNN